MKTKQTTRTCVQCHRKIESKLKNSFGICHHPDCPNYGLLAVPEELMPKLEKKV